MADHRCRCGGFWRGAVEGPYAVCASCGTAKDPQTCPKHGSFAPANFCCACTRDTRDEQIGAACSAFQEVRELLYTRSGTPRRGTLPAVVRIDAAIDALRGWWLKP